MFAVYLYWEWLTTPALDSKVVGSELWFSDGNLCKSKTIWKLLEGGWQTYIKELGVIYDMTTNSISNLKGGY